MTQHLYNFHYQQWFYNFFTNLNPCMEDLGSSPVNRIFRLSESASDDSNSLIVLNFLVFHIILRITARVPYEHNVLLRFVLHFIWLIIQKESSKFTWAELLHMPITLTFKASSAGVGLWHTLDWAFTLEISRRGRTVGIGFELGLSRGGSSVLALIIWSSLIVRSLRSL